MDLTGYELETLRDDGEFALHRARQLNNPVPVLTLVAGRQTLIKRLEHEYALADDLDSDWAARPLALVRNGGSATLVLEDNGGEPLDRLLDQRLEPIQFLRLAINLAAVVGQVHRRGLDPQGHQTGEYAGRYRRQCPAHRIWHRLATAARASGARAAGGHCRHPCLYRARADRPHEPLDRRPQRSLFARHHPV